MAGKIELRRLAMRRLTMQLKPIWWAFFHACSPSQPAHRGGSQSAQWGFYKLHPWSGGKRIERNPNMTCKGCGGRGGLRLKALPPSCRVTGCGR